MSQTRERGTKVSHSLVALSSAVVVAVYSAGWWRTRAAADELDAAARRPGPVPPLPGAGDGLPALKPHGAGEPARGDMTGGDASTVIFTMPTREGGLPPPPEPLPPTSTPVAAPATVAAAGRETKAETETRAAAGDASSPTASPAPAATAAADEPAAKASDATTAAAAAATPAAVAPAPSAPAPPLYKDGTYLGWGTSRHGDIQAQVVIEGGRIASATIAQCWTRYSCSWISPLPPQVAARQSPNVDYVSGATQSTYAFYYAVIEALGKAKP
jgi:uncharacterized protein with FMN-binding domain